MNPIIAFLSILAYSTHIQCHAQITPIDSGPKSAGEPGDNIIRNGSLTSVPSSSRTNSTEVRVPHPDLLCYPKIAKTWAPLYNECLGALRMMPEGRARETFSETGRVFSWTSGKCQIAMRLRSEEADHALWLELYNEAVEMARSCRQLWWKVFMVRMEIRTWGGYKYLGEAGGIEMMVGKEGKMPDWPSQQEGPDGSVGETR